MILYDVVRAAPLWGSSVHIVEKRQTQDTSLVTLTHKITAGPLTSLEAIGHQEDLVKRYRCSFSLKVLLFFIIFSSFGRLFQSLAVSIVKDFLM